MGLPESFALTDNPFAATPTRNPIWADRQKLKEQVTSALNYTLITSPSQIVACIWGDYGTGKTHTMNYFSREDVLTELVTTAGGSSASLPVVLSLIFPANEALKSLYLAIMKGIGIDRIRRAVEKAVVPGELEEHVGAGAEKLREITGDEYLGMALSCLHADPQAVLRYLVSKPSTRDQAKLGIPRPIETYDERVNALAGMLRLLTATTTPRVYLWIDDMERLGEASGKDLFEFRYLIRDLLDRVPEHMTILMNFTLAPNVTVAERISLLGEPLYRRVSRIFVVDNFTQSEFMTYVSDMLHAFRRTSRRAVPRFHPFTEECLSRVFGELDKMNLLTPRDANLRLSDLLELAASRIDELSDRGVIDAAFLDRVVQEVFPRTDRTSGRKRRGQS